MDSRYPDRPDSHQGGYPRGYPPSRFPNHPPSGGFIGLSSVTALVMPNNPGPDPKVIVKDETKWQSL
jgi:hypothetical protein